MRNQTTIKGLLISFVLVLALSGCSKNPSSSGRTDAQTSGSSSAASLETGSSAPEEKATTTLYIGDPDHLKEISIQNAATAKELIAALAKETGWNLNLANAPTAGALQNTLTVALAAKSAIYTAPPEPQKDSYHVFDSEDYVLTVLNSVSETLCRNLGLDGVYFTAPDGGVLSLTNGDYSFCFSNIYPWDYSLAKYCNKPLPQDRLGAFYASPEGSSSTVAGSVTLALVFQRSNIQVMPGTLTIYNDDGSILETIATDDSTKVQSEPVSDRDRNYYNLKEGEGSYFRIFPTKDFDAGKKYSVDVTAGAFAAEGGLKSEELTRNQWSFECMNMKATVTPRLGNKPVIKVGEPVTYHFEFSDDVKRISIKEPAEDAGYSCSVKELTSDGDIVITPNKPGEISWQIDVELKDGNIINMTENPTVVE